ncbi:hypothetical protein H072_924 [Dactylellina haptotyla CBS 200.50]|uniref:IDI-2 n=1 Tax=Dactylellina haptotyla (strain CBS 200.50) TaxID=1284197 RepID=S8AVZ5_DACHA|nr:hypothetical protein H072_924 [Dactylellina haptotyla CBS 200.50]
MKITTATLFAVAQATAVFGAAGSSTAAECGTLGVFSVSAEDLPEGVQLTDVRKCADHPLGRHRDLKNASLAPMNAEFIKRSQNNPEITADTVIATLFGRKASKCYYGAPYGCTDSYCWKSCGANGEWCWTASSGGLGQWKACSSFRDCSDSPGFACGAGCSGKSKACGCSC